MWVVLVTLLFLGFKVLADITFWGQVNHTFSAIAVWSGVIMLSIGVKQLYPLFLFGTLWNPILNIAKGLPLFYLGDTAKTDILLKTLFGPNGDFIQFTIMAILTILSILINKKIWKKIG